MRCEIFVPRLFDKRAAQRRLERVVVDADAVVLVPNESKCSRKILLHFASREGEVKAGGLTSYRPLPTTDAQQRVASVDVIDSRIEERDENLISEIL